MCHRGTFSKITTELNVATIEELTNIFLSESTKKYMPRDLVSSQILFSFH